MEKFLTITQVAELLHCSVRTIHRRIRDRKAGIPVVKIGGRFLFDEEDIEQWIDRKKQETERIYHPSII